MTKVEIISRKTIRPFSPTPDHLKNFKLSLLDQRLPPNLFGKMSFFYSSNTNHDHNHSDRDLDSQTLQISNHLQKSLSETLVHFYPLAGRLKDAATIECNDEGAYFIEAQINCHLLNFLSKPDPTLLHHFTPTCSTADAFGVILLVQLTQFNCGGFAIAVSLSHKIADGSSLCTFMKSWSTACSTISRNQNQHHVHGHTLFGPVLPVFNIGSSLLPPSNKLIPRILNITQQNYTTSRFVFSASKIASLKDETSTFLGINTNCATNVELVSAVVVRCAIAAAQSVLSSPRPSMVFQAVNLRKRMAPPLPSNAIGNLVWTFQVLIEKSDIKLHEVVVKMRKGLRDFCNDRANRFRGEDGFSLVHKSLTDEDELGRMGVNILRCTSLCKFPLYDVDFGWGKPSWVANLLFFKNFIVLVDTKSGDDIEAWVTLEEQEMAIFQRDETLLAYASFNPSAIVSQCRM